MVIEPGQPPRELNRLDSKNWSPTPDDLQRDLASRVLALANRVDALLLMDQVDLPDTGVVTHRVRDAARSALDKNPGLIVLADSRKGLHDFPPLGFKMNAAELARMTGSSPAGLEAVRRQAAELTARTVRPVFVTMAEHGIVGASPGQGPEHVLRSPSAARSTSSAPAIPSPPTSRPPWPREATSARPWNSPWPPPRSSSINSARPGPPPYHRSPSCSKCYRIRALARLASTEGRCP